MPHWLRDEEARAPRGPDVYQATDPYASRLGHVVVADRGCGTSAEVVSRCWWCGQHCVNVPTERQLGLLNRYVGPMLPALLGLSGVLVGAVLTQLFATSREWRSRRLEAMVALAAACGRVIGAHERIYELFQGADAPPLTSDRVIRALTERSDAHNEWRIACSRLEILIADDARLNQAVDEFNENRAAESKWVLAYLAEGEDFHFANFAELDNKSWTGMRAARQDIMALSRVRSARDASWITRLRLMFSGRGPNW